MCIEGQLHVGARVQAHSEGGIYVGEMHIYILNK